ncbi:MAG: TetR/AcrR family transcriptional regulator [Pseudomonadota bacterium]
MNKTETKAVVDAFMTALITTSYENISLRQVAETAKVPFPKMLGVFTSKIDLIAAFAQRVDEAVLADDDPEMLEEPPRERLFDVLMRRYDALLPHKLALIQLERDARREPALGLALVRIVSTSMEKMAAAADVSLDGARGRVVMGGLLQVHARVMRVWLKESDEGQALTMAELDKALRQAERRMNDIDRTVTLLRAEGGETGGPLCRLRAQMDKMRSRRSRSSDSGDASAEAA